MATRSALLRLEAQNQVRVVRDALRQLRGTELRGIDSDGFHQRVAGRINGMPHQTVGPRAADFERGALRVRTEKEFPHW